MNVLIQCRISVCVVKSLLTNTIKRRLVMIKLKLEYYIRYLFWFFYRVVISRSFLTLRTPFVQLIVLAFYEISGFRKVIYEVLLLSESFIVNFSLHFFRGRFTTLFISVTRYVVKKLNILQNRCDGLLCGDLSVFKYTALFLYLINIRTYALQRQFTSRASSWLWLGQSWITGTISWKQWSFWQILFSVFLSKTFLTFFIRILQFNRLLFQISLRTLSLMLCHFFYQLSF